MTEVPSSSIPETWKFQNKSVDEFLSTYLHPVPDVLLNQNIPLPRCNNVVIDVKFAPFCTLTRTWLLSHMANAHVVDGFAAVICHTRNPSSTQLMFPNSSLVFIGCPSKEESWLSCQKVRLALYDLGNAPNFDRLSVNNMVYDVKVGFHINLPALSKDTTLFVIWKRKIFPGAFLQDMKRRIRHLVFDSGKVVSMSSKSSDVVHEGWLELYEVLLRYKTDKPIEKKSKKKKKNASKEEANAAQADQNNDSNISEKGKQEQQQQQEEEEEEDGEQDLQEEDGDQDASARGNAPLSALGMLSDLTGTAETQQEAYKRVDEFCEMCKRLMRQGDKLPVARKKALKAMKAKEAAEIAEKLARQKAEDLARAESANKDNNDNNTEQLPQEFNLPVSDAAKNPSGIQATQKELQRTARELREAAWISATNASPFNSAVIGSKRKQYDEGTNEQDLVDVVDEEVMLEGTA